MRELKDCPECSPYVAGECWECCGRRNTWDPDDCQVCLGSGKCPECSATPGYVTAERWGELMEEEP